MSANYTYCTNSKINNNLLLLFNIFIIIVSDAEIKVDNVPAYRFLFESGELYFDL